MIRLDLMGGSETTIIDQQQIQGRVSSIPGCSTGAALIVPSWLLENLPSIINNL